MPRLVGNTRKTTANYTALLVGLFFVVLFGLEWSGAINLIPGFGGR